MPVTRTSLLVRLRADSDPAGWHEFVQLYEPLLRSWARRAGIQEHDIPDVVQNILLKLLRLLPRFEYSPARGRFRSWLGSVCRTSIADWRRGQRMTPAPLPAAETVTAGDDDRDWESEYRRHVLRHALATVQRHVAPDAWTCFERYVLQERSAAAVAEELSLTPAAVYVIASRVRARLRQKCAQFDEELA